MRKTSTAMQAAVVTMLVAKRPALDKLPVRWGLREDGTIGVEQEFGTTLAEVAEIAAELARAMRGARSETYDGVFSDGRAYRAFDVTAQPSGVRVSFHGQVVLDSGSTEASAGGESA
ncbi:MULTISPECIES: hypothetical protein [unclassified Streptomyces]|uniref:hypothetical protein n=1 Tax=unclassified Streptomyces TaxID=2593676 RepID=UPI00190E13EF|nr:MULTISPECIES: hypothetical protein [unclassified Streptomyces]MBK3563184.1 hypothetical protein [Streptomyces sp. MBT62]MBK6013173.1 hypothetical protein [Streptomyces sp. MBT53]